MVFEVKSDILEKLSTYVENVFYKLDVGGLWTEAANLPVFLQSSYLYRRASLLGRDCLLMLDLDEASERAGVSSIGKHVELVSKFFDGDVIYVVEDIASYNRKRLVEKKVSFVVPGKQLYLPLFALDFRETFKVLNKKPVKKLGSTAQVILLKSIYGMLPNLISTSDLLDELNVSKMNISRAYNELSKFGLVTTITSGRKKLFHFEDSGIKLWQKSFNYLDSPLKKTVWVDRYALSHIPESNLTPAGELALSFYGMLMEPKEKTYALDVKQWAEMKKILGIKELAHATENSMKVELWRYEPKLLTKKCIVDPLSLFLSLQTEDDERLDIEKEHLLNELWSEF
jgi:DNA-binding MarR family transcriptional regulator